jgi:hypothetical protein
MSPITIPFLVLGALILIAAFIYWFVSGFALGYRLSGRWMQNSILRFFVALGTAIAVIVLAILAILIWRFTTEPKIDHQKWIREHRHMVPPKDWERANQEWERQNKKASPK